MDVQCERCKTEYEFDDALVSARGTTVKCTNCGFQFKIRPAGATAEAERWVVDTVGGQRFVFTSLRELQKAITNRQVGRSDTLTRGNASPRVLGAIAELDPFFESSQESIARPAPPGGRDGGGPSAASSFPRRPPQVDFPTSPLAATVAVPSARQPDQPSSDNVPAPRARVDTLRPRDELSAAVPPPTQGTRLAAVESLPAAARISKVVPDRVPNESDRVPTDVLMSPMASPAPQPLAPLPVETATAVSGGPQLPPPTNPIRRQARDDVEVSEPMRLPALSYADSDALYPTVPRRRRVGGWVVALAVLAGAGFLGYRAFRPYLASLEKGGAAPIALDPRAVQFLNDGERALGEGNFETAKENFDKASALAEKDARVLLDVARLSAMRADVPWLRLRLLPTDAADDIRAANQSLLELGSGARKTAEDAVAAAPEDPAAVRAKVDALRIVGERDAARSLVTRIIATATQSETAYVLAALDLSEPDPLWSSVVDRLRIAAAGEASAGRAHAALIYALARAGDAAGAKSELDKLGAMPRPSPLLGALRSFVLKVPEKPPASAAVASGKPSQQTAAVDVNSLPHEPSGGGGDLGGDPRSMITQADRARTRGDYARAKMLYEGALAKNPRDSQALAGLGDVAYAQHDDGSAKSFYQQALANNPNYLPALIGIADVEWQQGDKDRAQKAYKDIADRFPDGTYPPRVKQRAEGGASTPSPPQGASSQSAPLTVPANTPTDLPGSQ